MRNLPPICAYCHDTLEYVSDVTCSAVCTVAFAALEPNAQAFALWARSPAARNARISAGLPETPPAPSSWPVSS